MLFAPSVCKGGLRSHFNLTSDGREPAREVAGKSQSGTGAPRRARSLATILCRELGGTGCLGQITSHLQRPARTRGTLE